MNQTEEDKQVDRESKGIPTEEWKASAK
jgi:hypothetical protein